MFSVSHHLLQVPLGYDNGFANDLGRCGDPVEEHEERHCTEAEQDITGSRTTGAEHQSQCIIIGDHETITDFNA